MKISKGKVQRAQRVVIYGPEGIGKSTLASEFPSPLYVDVEDGTAHLDVDRVDGIHKWEDILAVADEMARDSGGYKTLVVDTADRAEALCIQYICTKNSKGSIEAFGYGQGYVLLLEEFSRFLKKLDQVIKNGVNVVLLAHSALRKFEQPDEEGAYDRYELKLNKKTTAQTSAVVKEWADALLFVNFETLVITQENGRKKGKGGYNRVMYTTHTAAYDAKNRWGLPEKCPMKYEVLKPHIPDGGAVEAKVPTEFGDLYGLMTLSDIDEEELRSWLVESRGHQELDKPIKEWPIEAIRGIIAGWESLAEVIIENKQN